MLRDAMEEAGLFTVELACNGHEVLERIHAHEPELLVLDPALPGMDGIRVLRQLRREGCASEIFLISAFVSDHMLAEATELRVDYFLPKPFAFEELSARVRALLRKHSFYRNSTKLQLADLVVDTVSHTVSRGGDDIALSTKEYALLEYLLRKLRESGATVMVFTGIDVALSESMQLQDLHLQRSAQQ